jgi:hypothetical protein
MVLTVFFAGCTACNLAVTGSIIAALGLQVLVPYIGYLQLASFAMLLVTAYLVTRKVQNPVCRI